MQLSLDEYDDDGTGTVEDGVRVDAVLGKVGDRLGYDFGHGWTHRLPMIAATAHAHGARLATRNAGDLRGIGSMLEILSIG